MFAHATLVLEVNSSRDLDVFSFQPLKQDHQTTPFIGLQFQTLAVEIRHRCPCCGDGKEWSLSPCQRVLWPRKFCWVCESHAEFENILSRYHYHNCNVIRYCTDLSAVTFLGWISQGPVVNQWDCLPTGLHPDFHSLRCTVDVSSLELEQSYNMRVLSSDRVWRQFYGSTLFLENFSFVSNFSCVLTLAVYSCVSLCLSALSNQGARDLFRGCHCTFCSLSASSLRGASSIHWPQLCQGSLDPTFWWQNLPAGFGSKDSKILSKTMEARMASD